MLLEINKEAAVTATNNIPEDCWLLKKARKSLDNRIVGIIPLFWGFIMEDKIRHIFVRTFEGYRLHSSLHPISEKRGG